MIKVNLLNINFGKLLVIKENGKDRFGNYRWRCLCQCGKIKTIASRSLINGYTKSCGCLLKVGGNLKHGMRRKKHTYREYRTWQGMKQRCNNKNDLKYKYYGGRGIKICKRWYKFINFYNDMGRCPDGLTIERINNNIGYKPSNCKWATYKEQNLNRRKNVIL